MFSREIEEEDIESLFIHLDRFSDEEIELLYSKYAQENNKNE